MTESFMTRNTCNGISNETVLLGLRPIAFWDRQNLRGGPNNIFDADHSNPSPDHWTVKKYGHCCHIFYLSFKENLNLLSIKI